MKWGKPLPAANGVATTSSVRPDTAGKGRATVAKTDLPKFIAGSPVAFASSRHLFADPARLASACLLLCWSHPPGPGGPLLGVWKPEFNAWCG